MPRMMFWMEATLLSNSSGGELAAIAAAWDILKNLDSDEQKRAATWIADKVGVRVERFSNSEITSAPSPGVGASIKEGTISTVAARLQVKSCRDLFVAAAVHLALYQGKERFSRSEWIACGKEAKQWKVDYSVQMATTISRLLNAGFVNEVSRDVFTVPDDKLKQLEMKLGS